jgi:hypothetical protein
MFAASMVIAAMLAGLSITSCGGGSSSEGGGGGGSTPPVVVPPVVATAITQVIDDPANPGVQIIMTSPNTLTPGTFIVISGATNPSYNGTFAIVSATATTFTIAAAFVGDDTTAVWQAGGGLIAGCTTTGGTGAITLSGTASRFTGVAPLAVFFDATSTTATATTRPFHDLEYRWNFGDPGSGAWATGSRPGASSRNAATGPVAGHVFETPGTYTVSLDITDGTSTVSNACVQIAVLDPDVVFAGTNTICFSTSGTFSDAPAGFCTVPGVTAVTISDFAAAINTFRGTGKRLLFRRGETWTSAAPAIINVTGPGTIGAFGSALARPKVLNTGAPPNVLVIGSASTPNITDWRAMDLEIDGAGNPLGIDTAAVAGGGGAHQITLLRLNAHDLKFGANFAFTLLDFFNSGGSPGHTLWDQLAIVDTNISNLNDGSVPPTFNGGNGMFLSASRLMLLGNSVSNSTSAEHNVRIQFANFGVIQNNNFAFPNVTKALLTLRSHVFGAVSVTGGGFTEKVVISDNLFQSGLDATPITIGPSNNSSDHRVRDVIFERNLSKAGAATQNALTVQADEVTVRNNILIMTGAAAYNCMVFERNGIEPAHSQIRIYHNTCFSNDSGVGAPPPTLRVVFLRPDVSNVTIVNNLGFAPNMITSPVFLTNTGATSVTGGSGTFGNSSDFQIKNTDPGFVNASGTFGTATDFLLSPGYARDGGLTFPTDPTGAPVFSDFFRITRPSGSATDAGATEQ